MIAKPLGAAFARPPLPSTSGCDWMPTGSEGSANMPQILGLLVGLAAFAGWCQHLYTCFNEKLWGFLIAGALFFPIAIIHGWGIWLGWWH
jgi:hypothetical protein